MAADLTSHPHSRRFIAAAVVLAVLLATAVAATIVLAGADRSGPWSDIRPAADDPIDRAREIGDAIAPRFTDAAGGPLVGVLAGEDLVPDLPGRTQVAAVTDGTGANYAFDYYPAGESGILFYKLCGTEPGCALTPGADPATLLSMFGREALELALHGLTYVEPAGGVIVELPTGFPPPAPGATAPRTAFYFPERAVRSLLDRPFDETYPSPPRPYGVFDAADLGDTRPLIAASLVEIQGIQPAADQATLTYRLVRVPTQ